MARRVYFTFDGNGCVKVAVNVSSSGKACFEIYLLC